MLKKVVLRILGLPNHIYNSIVLNYRHVKVGKNLRISGRIYCVSNTPDGIEIGDNVSINSCRDANPIGGDTKTILFAKGDGRIQIGDGCGLSNCTIFACELIVLGKNVLIGGNSKVYDTDFHWLDYERRVAESRGQTNPVVIKDGAFIGAHSVILKGVTIGERSVIGAGSVVTKDVPNDEMWAGNPARFIRKLRNK